MAPALAEVDRAAALRDMREIFASIQVLLPLTVDDQAFRSAEAHDRILAAFDRLAKHSVKAGDHIAGDDRRINYLAGELSNAALEAKDLFENREYPHAQFLVRRFTDFCIACHTRVPSLADSPLTQGFVSDRAIAKLSPVQRASIQVATRRFDDALASYEAIFASDTRPAELLEPLTEYLRVAIRVKYDLDRARGELEKFSRRPDLWSILKTDVEDWLAALDRFSESALSPPSIERARRMLDDAHANRRYPLDSRGGLVQRDLAASELHRYLDKHSGESGADVAEVYYLLGLIEGRSPFGHLVYESDFYLESAIRLSPQTSIGRNAFALLEERAIVGWTGSGGTRMPLEVRRKLDALRALVGAPAPPTKSPAR
ncbi:MAG: hypothetical protein QF570_13910 [Myxococcota bacterium]|nr:hypothetical protein [Myxococcota bacterium]